MRKAAASLTLLGAALPCASDGAIVYSGWLDLQVPPGGSEKLFIPLAKDGLEFGTLGFRFRSDTFGQSLGTSVRTYREAFFHQFALPKMARAGRNFGGLNLIGRDGGYAVRYFGSLDLIDIANVNRAASLTAGGTGSWNIDLGRPASQQHPVPGVFLQAIGFESATGQLGWVRTEVTALPEGASYRILDWAVETEPGKAIEVFPVPEPSPTGLAALALGAAAVFRRRRSFRENNPRLG